MVFDREDGEYLVTLGMDANSHPVSYTHLDVYKRQEILLLKRRQNDVWETLVKPGKKAKPGTKIIFGDGLCLFTRLYKSLP